MSELCDVPIVACTARSSAGEREDALKAGCTDLIPKPIDKETIEIIIRRFLPGPGAAARSNVGPADGTAAGTRRT
jgi:CheY-like chemotaxis protein